ncbi:hypothetical protein BDV12DRAFT_176447 [Aspergillus spectabilis]
MVLTPRSFPMGLNEIGYITVVVTILFLALSVIAVGLRFRARQIKRASFGLDDWLALASAVFFFAFCANIMVCVYTRGSGQVYHDPAEAHRQMVMYLKSLYAIPPLYAVNVTLIKLSILFLYRRIFSVPKFRCTNNFIIALCLVWCLVGVICDLLYCIPIRQQWDPTAGGQCFDFSLYFLIMTLADLLIDIIILSLPMSPIIRLHLSWRKRVGLAGIFLLGAFVLVTGAVRIFYVYNPSSRHVAHSEAALWSVINLGVAIICSCLPTYPSLLVCFRRQGSSMHSQQSHRGLNGFSGYRMQTGIKGIDNYGRRERYFWRVEKSTSHTILLPQIGGSPEQDDQETSGIYVRRDVKVVENL